MLSFPSRMLSGGIFFWISRCWIEIGTQPAIYKISLKDQPSNKKQIEEITDF